MEALRTWPAAPPAEPAAWLLTVARRRARDRLRRDATLAGKLPLLIVGDDDQDDDVPPPHDIPDERLRMIFTTCHPALAAPARIALTLRYAAGLPTAEIARLFHTSEPTMAARLTRAKQKIAIAGIPYRVPRAADLPERVAAILHVVYLVFTAGHAPARGDAVVRPELCDEALRLARLLDVLLPGTAGIAAIRALIALTHARTPARTAGAAPVLLADQDRGRWDRALIDEGLGLLDRAGAESRYALEACIAAEHVHGPDWARVAELYARLEERHPAPAVRLNRAVAVAEAQGPTAGLALLDAPGLERALGRGHALHLARAELLARAGDPHAAVEAFIRAEERAGNGAVRAHVARRRAALAPSGA